MERCPTCLNKIDGQPARCPMCGQAFCTGCFEPLAVDATRCDKCGEEVTKTCSACHHQFSRSAPFCPECGQSVAGSGPIAVPEYTRIRRETETGREEEPFTGACPECGSNLYVEDGFCGNCGQSICTACGHRLDDDEGNCPGCGVKLFFPCPLCDFELTAGAESCPNCEALFPIACAYCGGEVQTLDERCLSCRRPLEIRPRQSARTIRTFLVDKHLVRMIACPGCGRHFDPATGPCGKCSARVCAGCQLVLVEDERFCPRCAQEAINAVSRAPGRQSYSQ